MESKTLFIFIGDYCFRKFMVNDKRQSVKTIEMIDSKQSEQWIVVNQTEIKAFQLKNR